MNASLSKESKRPHGANNPFPWRCPHCGMIEVVMQALSYEAGVRHDGHLYQFMIPKLDLPICQACGEKVFTEKVDEQINSAFRSHLHLLTPEEIMMALHRINMTPKEAASRLGIEEETLLHWVNGVQIQSRAMDKLLRVFFAFPQVRTVLGDEFAEPQLGASDLSGWNGRGPNSLQEMTRS
jgi:DNA-binding transcriptional regulator YiaG